MKKILVLLLALIMTVACTVHAEGILDADPEAVLTFDRESPVTDWVGEWVLAAAYIGEEFAEDNDIETTGFIAVPEKAVTMSVAAVLDASATGSPDGVMVDMGNYIHAHVYDMQAAVKFDPSISEEEVSMVLPWDGWLYTVRGENDGDFNKGVGKLNKPTNEKTLCFEKVTGVENEAISDERMTYMGMNTSGQLIVCYSDDNLVRKDGEIGYAYIFVRAE